MWRAVSVDGTSAKTHPQAAEQQMPILLQEHKDTLTSSHGGRQALQWEGEHSVTFVGILQQVEFTCHQLQTCTAILCPLKHRLWVNATPLKPLLLSSKSSESTHLIYVSVETRAHGAAKWQWPSISHHSKSPQTLSSWRVYLHNSILTKCIELPFQAFWQLLQWWGSPNEWIWMFSKPQVCNNSPFTTDFLFFFCTFHLINYVMIIYIVGFLSRREFTLTLGK